MSKIKVVEDIILDIIEMNKADHQDIGMTEAQRLEKAQIAGYNDVRYVMC